MAADDGAPGDRELNTIAKVQDSSISTAARPAVERGGVAVADEPGPEEAAVDDIEDGASGETTSATVPASPLRLAMVLGAAAFVATAALAGWLGFGAYESHQAQQQRDLYLQAGRQGALNLSTIDWQHADADVQRIADSSIGSFYDDFVKRQQAFVDIVKKAQSSTVGTITDAGLESESGREAQVLVLLSVKTSNPTAPDQAPQTWRMRLSLQRADANDAKITNVEFVP